MNVAVATDGSKHSEAAIEYAVRLAGETDGSVTIVHAAEPAVHSEGGTDADAIADLPDAAERLLVEAPEDAHERGERILDNAAAIVEADVPVRTELLEGETVEVISDFAGSEDVDGVVVGHRGLSGRYQDHLGSVAKSLIERSPVPVTVVSGEGGRPERE